MNPVAICARRARGGGSGDADCSGIKGLLSGPECSSWLAGGRLVASAYRSHTRSKHANFTAVCQPPSDRNVARKCHSAYTGLLPLELDWQKQLGNSLGGRDSSMLPTSVASRGLPWKRAEPPPSERRL